MVKTYRIQRKIPYDRYVSKVFDLYFGDARLCVLDIETTGLAPDQSRFILGGLLFVEEGEAELLQLFAEDPDEEKELLAEYLAQLKKCDLVLTYNGKHFDIPFLQKRAEKYEVDIAYMPYNLDLYRVLSKHSSLRKFLPNLRQKTVEDFMGFWHLRTDSISGGESALLYHEYLRCRENGEELSNFVDILCLHNRDDVLQLGRLLPVLEKTDLHHAMFSLGFPVLSTASSTKLAVEKITLTKNALTVSGRQTASPLAYLSYGGDTEYRLAFDEWAATFEVSLPLLSRMDLSILDIEALPGNLSAELGDCPHFESGFLALAKKGEIYHWEVNLLVKLFLKHILEKGFGGMPYENTYQIGYSF